MQLIFNLIMTNSRMKNSLLTAVSKYSMSGNLMRHLRSDKATIRFAVNKVIENHEEVNLN